MGLAEGAHDRAVRLLHGACKILCRSLEVWRVCVCFTTPLTWKGLDMLSATRVQCSSGVSLGVFLGWNGSFGYKDNFAGMYSQSPVTPVA